MLLKVSDQQNLYDTKVWYVKINKLPVNQAPRITDTRPAIMKLTIKQGETIEFSAAAIDPDKSDEVTFLWTLDGIMKQLPSEIIG